MPLAPSRPLALFGAYVGLRSEPPFPSRYAAEDRSWSALCIFFDEEQALAARAAGAPSPGEALDELSAPSPEARRLARERCSRFYAGEFIRHAGPAGARASRANTGAVAPGALSLWPDGSEGSWASVKLVVDGPSDAAGRERANAAGERAARAWRDSLALPEALFVLARGGPSDDSVAALERHEIEGFAALSVAKERSALSRACPAAPERPKARL